MLRLSVRNSAAGAAVRWSGRTRPSCAALLRQIHASGPLMQQEEKQEKRMGMFHPKVSVASPSFTNRWAVVLPAFATHMCIGSPWAWSVMSGALSRNLGVVAASAGDWSMYECTLPLSFVFALQGISAALGSSWAMKVGPRASMAVASLCFGGGMMIAGLGVEMHNLSLVYAGYGLLSGTGVGLAYTPPVQSLIAWFPDKKGLASGLTIAGFGSGALVFTPLVQGLMEKFARMPQYLGSPLDVETQVEGGKLFADVGGRLVEAVRVGSAELARLPYDGLSEGLYAVGTGSTGAAEALMISGALYTAIMMTSAFTIRSPAPGYSPPGWTPPAPAASESGDSSAHAQNVKANDVLKTPQFYLLGTTFFCLACGGMGIMAVAKPMMSQVFSSTLPTLVTASFASQYVQVMAAGNLGGRIGWAAVSDAVGRRPTFHMFTAASVPLYLAVPYCVEQVVETGSSTMLYAFMGTTFVAITYMGGVYSILPAYEADLFGSKYIGPIHGRMLLFSSAAALAGPSIVLKLRDAAEVSAIQELLEKVEPAKFEAMFGAPMSASSELIASKALTIPSLMQLAPSGTVDPSPFVYDSTMYAMAGLMGVATIAHGLVQPVHPKHFEKIDSTIVDITPSSSKMAQDSFRYLSSMASHHVPLARNP
jgi:hypothetical protein